MSAPIRASRIRHARGRPGLGGQRPDRCMQGCGGLHQHERAGLGRDQSHDVLRGHGNHALLGRLGPGCAERIRRLVHGQRPLSGARCRDRRREPDRRQAPERQARSASSTASSSDRAIDRSSVASSGRRPCGQCDRQPLAPGRSASSARHALWLLDPRGCTSLAVSGGYQGAPPMARAPSKACSRSTPTARRAHGPAHSPFARQRQPAPGHPDERRQQGRPPVVRPATDRDDVRRLRHWGGRVRPGRRQQRQDLAPADSGVVSGDAVPRRRHVQLSQPVSGGVLELPRHLAGRQLQSARDSALHRPA